MKFAWNGTTLADVQDLSMVPSGFGLNGSEYSEEVPYIQALRSLFLGRGNRSVACGVLVNYGGFANHAETLEFALCKWNDLAQEGTLDITVRVGSTDYVYRLAGAILNPPEIAPGTIHECAAMVRWSWKGPRFEALTPVDSTDLYDASLRDTATTLILAGAFDDDARPFCDVLDCTR